MVASALLTLAGTQLPALGDPGGASGAVPSKVDVQRARERAADAAQTVASVRADLARANAEAEATAVRAAQAAEAYNGAKWQLRQATATLARAKRDAARATRLVEAQRDELAGVVAASYQSGTEVTSVGAVLGEQGPEGLMSQLLAFQGASASMNAKIQRFSATSALAEVFTAEAEKARAAQADLVLAAEQRRQAASAAAARAVATAAAVSQRKSVLLRRLATLQGVSVRLAERRQAALEEIERRRKEAQAQAAAQAAAAAAAEAAAQQAAQQDAQQDAQQAAQQDDQASQEAAQESAPDEAPAPPQGSGPALSGGAAAAVAFARAQLGERYVWGAAGPDAWDCSGLTMGAWGAGGVSLPHYSVAQYEATTPISPSALRPGDLVFWGSSSQPSSIYHVALYIGDGMILHAPRAGRPVTVDSMYYWIAPNFFSRV